MEAEEHDGEDDPAVLVNVAGPDAQYLVGRPLLPEGARGKERSGSPRLSRQGVSRPSAAEPHLSFLQWEVDLKKCICGILHTDKEGKNCEKFHNFLYF